jgi:hypothetical protein
MGLFKQTDRYGSGSWKNLIIITTNKIQKPFGIPKGFFYASKINISQMSDILLALRDIAFETS